MADDQIGFRDVFPQVGGYGPKPLVKLSDGRYSFVRDQGRSKKKVIVNSWPKSGTYMFAKLLESLDLVNTHVHLGGSIFWDFRDVPMSAVIKAPDDFVVFLPFRETHRLVLGGQFCVGHVEYSDDQVPLLQNFVHFFCVRDIRDALVSYMRFILDERRRDRAGPEWSQLPDGPERFCGFLKGPGKEYIDYYANMLPWVYNKDRIMCRFEEALGDFGVTAQRQFFECFAEPLELSANHVLSLFESKVIGQETRTYSGARSNFADYCSDEVQEALEEIGANHANNILGYS